VAWNEENSSYVTDPAVETGLKRASEIQDPLFRERVLSRVPPQEEQDNRQTAPKPKPETKNDAPDRPTFHKPGVGTSADDLMNCFCVSCKLNPTQLVKGIGLRKLQPSTSDMTMAHTKDVHLVGAGLKKESSQFGLTPRDPMSMAR